MKIILLILLFFCSALSAAVKEVPVYNTNGVVTSPTNFWTVNQVVKTPVLLIATQNTMLTVTQAILNAGTLVPTNAQPPSANLTNWSGVATNVPFDFAALQGTNAAANASNAANARADSKYPISSNGLPTFRRELASMSMTRPWPGFDTWYQFGATFTWNDASNFMFWGTNYQMQQAVGYNHLVLFNDGWQNPGGRTGAHLYPDPAKYPLNATNSCAVAHFMGWDVGIYVQNGTVTSAGMTPNNRSDIPTDVADIYNAGIDFIRMDLGPGGLTPTNCLGMLEQLMCWRNEIEKYPKPIWIMTSGWNEQLVPGALSVSNREVIRRVFEIANVVQTTEDAASPANSTNYWTNILARFRACAPFIEFVKPKHFMRNDHPLIHTNGPAGSAFPVDMGLQNIALDAMLACVIEPQYPYVYGGGRASAGTNTDLYGIATDQLCIPARKYSTNEFAETWARPLTAGRQAVAFINTSVMQKWGTTVYTNADAIYTNCLATNITFEFRWVGWPTNTVCKVRDAITQTDWASPVTNGMTITLPGINCSNYILTPILSF